MVRLVAIWMSQINKNILLSILLFCTSIIALEIRAEEDVIASRVIYFDEIKTNFNLNKELTRQLYKQLILSSSKLKDTHVLFNKEVGFKFDQIARKHPTFSLRLKLEKTSDRSYLIQAALFNDSDKKVVSSVQSKPTTYRKIQTRVNQALKYVLKSLSPL
jgi:hypothetical protein